MLFLTPLNASQLRFLNFQYLVFLNQIKAVLLLRGEAPTYFDLLITTLLSNNATLTNTLIRELTKSNTILTLRTGRLHGCICMRARLHVSTFEFSRALTASYHITQPLTENGRVTISLLLKARPPSYRACLRFSHAVITYVVFCFLLSVKLANIMREKANGRKERDAAWLSFCLRAHLGFTEPRWGLK